MSVSFSPIGNGFQFFSRGGLPLIGGTINTYAAGTSTPQATYTDKNGGVANANPIVLLSDGRLANEVWLTAGVAYRFDLKDALGTLIATYDDIRGIGDLATTTLIPSPGTTAVSLATLVGGVYNVMAYGAKGDAITDDTVAIQAAFTAAGLASNATVYFPPGRYSIQTKITITGTRISVIGAGRHAAVILDSVVGNPADPLFEAQATNDLLLFEGLRFFGNGLTAAGGNGHAIALMGTDADWLQFITIRDCEFTQISGNGKSKSGVSIPACGVYGYSVMNVRVDGSFFSNGNYGLRFEGSVGASQRLLVTSNNFDIMAAGIYCPSLLENMVVNGMNVFTQITANAIFLSDFELVKIDGNRFKNCTGTAVLSSTGTYNASGLAITDNYFYNFTNSPGIEVGTRVGSPRIEGNEFLFVNTITAGVGIRIYQEATWIGFVPRIINNRFTFGGTCTVANCIVLDNTTTAINGAVIKGNFIGAGNVTTAWTVTRGITVGNNGGAGDCVGAEISNNTILPGATGTVTTGIRLGANTFGARTFDNYLTGCGTEISNLSPNAATPMWQVVNGAFITMPNIVAALTQVTVGAVGGAAALPATPLGYKREVVNGVVVASPYYNP